jgi:hypothetical protein
VLSKQLYVFEVNQLLPKFATFLPTMADPLRQDAEAEGMPKSFVEFSLGQIKIDSVWQKAG